MLDNVLAIKGLVVDEAVAMFAIEELMLDFALWTTALNHHAQRPGRSARGMRDVWWNEESVPLTQDMVHDPTVFIGLHDNIALDLVEELFAVGLVKVVAGIGSADHHHEEISSTVEVLVANRWLKVRFVFLGPCHEIGR